MTMDEKELLRQLSERYPPQEESGQQIPDWMMQGGQPAQMPMGMQLLPERPEGAMPGTGLPQSAGADSSLGEGAFDEEEAIGEDEVRKANDLLQKYKAGKAALDKRIIENELWFRMGHWKNYENKEMITIIYDEKGKDMSLQASGHAGYAPKGQDIVCAAVSTLMQSLAYSVDSGTVTCDPGGDNILRVQASRSLDTLAKFELVMDGLYLLAQQYPENVRLVNLHANDMDLQLFGDGAAAGSSGDGAQASEGESSPVAPPALRPAQERLAKRSRPGKAAKATTEKNLQPPAGGSSLNEGAKVDAERLAQEEAEPDKGNEQEQGGETEENVQLTPEQRRNAFAKAMQQYPEEFEEAMQHAARMAVQSIRENPQLNELGKVLAEAYGIDMSDMDGLIDAVKNGRVKNDEYYETLAAQRGISVKTAREMDRMEGQLQRANAEKQQAEQLRLAAEHQQRAAAVRARWEAEAAKLKNSYPDFELDEVLNNPAVADMIRRGVGLEAAYRAAYFDRLMENQTARTAKQVEQGVATRIQQRGQRPAENGTHPGGAAEMKVDVAHMTRQQRKELARRAQRGERIVL